MGSIFDSKLIDKIRSSQSSTITASGFIDFICSETRFAEAALPWLTPIYIIMRQRWKEEVIKRGRTEMYVCMCMCVCLCLCLCLCVWMNEWMRSYHTLPIRVTFDPLEACCRVSIGSLSILETGVTGLDSCSVMLTNQEKKGGLVFCVFPSWELPSHNVEIARARKSKLTFKNHIVSTTKDLISVTKKHFLHSHNHS